VKIGVEGETTQPEEQNNPAMNASRHSPTRTLATPGTTFIAFERAWSQNFADVKMP
jgi:hypothetical protein